MAINQSGSYRHRQPLGSRNRANGLLPFSEKLFAGSVAFIVVICTSRNFSRAFHDNKVSIQTLERENTTIESHTVK